MRSIKLECKWLCFPRRWVSVQLKLPKRHGRRAGLGRCWGRGTSAAGSAPGGRAAVPVLCPPLEVCAICLSRTLFTAFSRNHGIATTHGFFLITFHCLCGNTQVLSTAVPRACGCLVAVAWPLVPSPSADGAAGWLLLPRCHPARLNPLFPLGRPFYPTRTEQCLKIVKYSGMLKL